MEFNADNLKAITDNAITRLQLEAERQKEIDTEKQRIEEEARQAKAQFIIQEVIEKAQHAASTGKNKVHVMRLEKYGKNPDVSHVDGQTCSRYNLNTTAATIYDYFVSAGFIVEIYYDHDSVGINDWFQMWISW